MQSRRFAVVVTLVIVVAFVVVAVAPAFAAAPGSLALHARLASSAPKDGATVETATEVVLTFSEDVNPDFVAMTVTGPDGPEVTGKPRADGATVTQALAADLPPGEHTATYRVVSADGHPVSGSVAFTTTAAPASATPSGSAPATPAPAASAVASPQPSLGTAPASQGTGAGATAWLVVAVVAVLGVLGLGAAWRTIAGPEADAEADAADLEDDDEVLGPGPADRGRTPTA